VERLVVNEDPDRGLLEQRTVALLGSAERFDDVVVRHGISIVPEERTD
jgi:hypothetical protein